jgi:hypothetical protein
MLKPAPMKPAPKNAIQNTCHGIHGGISDQAYREQIAARANQFGIAPCPRKSQTRDEAQTVVCGRSYCPGFRHISAVYRNSRLPSAIAAVRTVRLNRRPTPQTARTGLNIGSEAVGLNEASH